MGVIQSGDHHSQERCPIEVHRTRPRGRPHDHRMRLSASVLRGCSAGIEDDATREQEGEPPMTLSDFVRDVKNAIAPKPQLPPAYAYPVPVRVVQAPAPMSVPARP